LRLPGGRCPACRPGERPGSGPLARALRPYEDGPDPAAPTAPTARRLYRTSHPRGRARIETLFRLLAGIGLILANGFFVVTEFALTRLRQFSREEVGETANLDRAWKMTEELEIYLTGCQLGITASSILLGVVAEPAVTHLLEAAVGAAGVIPTATGHVVSVSVAVVVINLVHKVWGEQAPTYLGVERPLGVLDRLSPGLWWWTRIMRPVIMLGDGLAKGTLGLFGVEISRSWTEAEEDEGPITSLVELRQRLRGLLDRGDLDRERRREVVRALEIQGIPVRQIMVPREEVFSVSTELPLEENLRRMAEVSHLRFPLVGEGLDDLRGTVYLSAAFAALEDLRAGRTTLEELAVPPLLLDPELSVSDAIDRFQEEREELAYVARDGRVTGILTSTDALEAIAGELRDPFD